MIPLRRLSLFLLPALLLGGCDSSSWNNPHALDEREQTVMYYSPDRATRVKHLDPARSFSANESEFIDNVYEPPLQYHYLKRPYELEPATLTKMPTLSYVDENGKTLPSDTKAPAFSVYEFEIKPGIMYQPHPSFAKNEDGSFAYDFKTFEESADYLVLDDFTKTGTQELIADDYIYQIKRLADPRRLAPLRSLLSDYIVGMTELSAQAAKARETMGQNDWLDLRKLEMSGLNKIDDHHFTIRLKGKYPQFKYWLAMHFFAPVPWQVDRFYHMPGLPERNITLDWHPVGTGAYMMTQNKPNAETILERNPNFRDEYYPTEGAVGDKELGFLDNAGKKLPFIDKFVVSLEKEQIPAWTKFLQGYYDRQLMTAGSFDQAVSVQSEGLNLSEEMEAKGISMQQVIRPSTFYMGFNMLDPVVGGYNERGRKLRRAIAIVYNTEEFLKIFKNGLGELGMSPVPPGIFGYQQGETGINNGIFDWVDGKVQRKPIEYAKQLLAEAGYPDGRDAKTGEPLVLNFDATSSSTTKAQLNWMKKQFKKINLQLNVRVTDYNRFKGKLETANVQIYSFGWIADYPDPENFLFLLYGPNAQIDSTSGVNSANYKNPKYDALFEEMRLLDNTPERAAIIGKMLRILEKDTPWGYMFHGVQYELSHDWLENNKIHGISKVMYKYLKVDVEKRQPAQDKWNKPVVLPLFIVFAFLLLLIIPGYLFYQRRQKRTIGA